MPRKHVARWVFASLALSLVASHRYAAQIGVPYVAASEQTPPPPNAPPPTPAQEQPEVLTRGPVHEASGSRVPAGAGQNSDAADRGYAACAQRRGERAASSAKWTNRNTKPTSKIRAARTPANTRATDPNLAARRPRDRRQHIRGDRMRQTTMRVTTLIIPIALPALMAMAGCFGDHRDRGGDRDRAPDRVDQHDDHHDDHHDSDRHDEDRGR